MAMRAVATELRWLGGYGWPTVVGGLAVLAPALYWIIQSQFTLGLAWLAVVGYVVLCFSHIDIAIMSYLFVVSSAINLPELVTLEYTGLILANVMLGVLLVAALTQVALRRQRTVSSPMDLPMLLFFGLLALYAFWSVGPLYPDLFTSLRAAKLVLVFPVYYWIVLNGVSVRQGGRARFFVVGVMVTSAIATAQALWTYRRKLVEQNVTHWNDLRINRGEVFGETLYMTCTLAMLLLMYCMMRAQSHLLYRGIALGGIFVFAITNMLFLSRAGSGAMVVAALVFVMLFRRRGRVAWLLVLTAILTVSVWSVPQISERVEWTYTTRPDGTVDVDPSLGARLYYLWPRAIALMWDHVIWGIGHGNFQRTVGDGVHNQFMTWLVELGVIGFAVAMWFYVKQCVFLWRRFDEERDEWAKAMALSALSVMLASVVWLQMNDFFLFGWLYGPLTFLAVLARRAEEAKTAREVIGTRVEASDRGAELKRVVTWGP
jgi:O-antigen ligase